MLVAIDSNFVDLAEKIATSGDHIDAMEARGPPPRFELYDDSPEPEVWACYWLLTMGPAWTSIVYTYSDALPAELAAAEPFTAYKLLRTVTDVFSRDVHPEELVRPDPALSPALKEVNDLGIKRMDAVHVADGVGLGCSVLLMNDRRMRNKSDAVEARWGLRLRRPSEFLVEAVRSGAPWPVGVPWPWESLERIKAGLADIGDYLD